MYYNSSFHSAGLQKLDMWAQTIPCQLTSHTFHILYNVKADNF